MNTYAYGVGWLFVIGIPVLAELKRKNRKWIPYSFPWEWFKGNSSKIKYMRNAQHTVVNLNIHLQYLYDLDCSKYHAIGAEFT